MYIENQKVANTGYKIVLKYGCLLYLIVNTRTSWMSFD